MKSFHRYAVLLLIPTLLAGCRRWEAQLEGPREVLSNPDVGHVRLTRNNRQQVEVRVAEIQGDSIYGTIGGSGPVSCVEAGSMCNAQIPISDVGFVEVRRFSLMRTMALVAVPVGAFVVTLFADEPCRPLAGQGC